MTGYAIMFKLLLQSFFGLYSTICVVWAWSRHHEGCSATHPFLKPAAVVPPRHGDAVKHQASAGPEKSQASASSRTTQRGAASGSFLSGMIMTTMTIPLRDDKTVSRSGVVATWLR